MEAAERGAAPEDALFLNAHDAALARMDWLELEVATGKPTGLHAGGGDNPQVAVDLFPNRPSHLAGAGRGEDEEARAGITTIRFINFFSYKRRDRGLRLRSDTV